MSSQTRVALASFLLSFPALSEGFVSQVFLLSPKLRYDYLYRSSETQRDMLLTAYVLVDSGTVSYIVLDSTIANDSTVHWQVQQVRHLLHRRTAPYYPASDTTYMIIDTTYLRLTESLTGLHPLSGSGFVWSFPLQNPDQQVARFAANRSPAISHPFSYGNYPFATWGKDSLAFSDSLGFWYFYSSSYWGSSSNGGLGDRRATLQGSPTTDVQLPDPPITGFTLQQNFPNPFNPETCIRFSLSKPSHVYLSVSDVVGREIAVLANGIFNAGDHQIVYNCSSHSTGVYFCRMVSNGVTQLRKMVFVK